MKNSRKSAIVPQPVMNVVLRPPFVGLERLVEGMDGALGQRRRQRNGRPDERGAGDALGCSAASTTPQSAAHDTPTRTARSVAVASITASVSAANSRIAYVGALGAVGRAVPAPVERDDAECRARHGICIFQWREWMSAHAGSSRIVGSPEP